MKTSGRLLKSLGLTGIGLCVLCCALPPIGIVLGIGAFSVAAKYLEWAGVAALAAAAVASFVFYMRRRKAPSCSVDCECKSQDAPFIDVEKKAP
jgi:hypothetical protein